MKALSYLMLIAGLTISGCDKNPDVPHTADCQIVKLKGGLVTGDSLVITYNHSGNPVRITRATSSTGYPDFVFKYDQKGRMTDYYGVYYSDNPYFEIWHRYYYDAKDRIILDTTYSFGYIGPGMPVPGRGDTALRLADVFTYTYDSQDRITEARGKFRTLFYTYNHKGNLVKVTTQSASGTQELQYTFDNKTGLRRTHKIWQFLDRDYSINNSIPVSSYNKYGLPLTADFSSNGNVTFAGINVLATTITYSCR